jgi:hypothetical protein
MKSDPFPLMKTRYFLKYWLFNEITLNSSQYNFSRLKSCFCFLFPQAKILPSLTENGSGGGGGGSM